VAAPFFSCLPSIWVVCGAGLSGLLCTLCPSTFGATGQVAAVDGVAGLTPLEQSWWNFVKSSPVLTGKSVGSFLAQSASGPAVPRLRRSGRVSYHQISASSSPGGRPCRPAVPRCVFLLGNRGPLSCVQCPVVSIDPCPSLVHPRAFGSTGALTSPGNTYQCVVSLFSLTTSLICMSSWCVTVVFRRTPHALRPGHPPSSPACPLYRLCAPTRSLLLPTPSTGWAAGYSPGHLRPPVLSAPVSCWHAGR
jgi:hypothetical protein